LEDTDVSLDGPTGFVGKRGLEGKTPSYAAVTGGALAGATYAIVSYILHIADLERRECEGHNRNFVTPPPRQPWNLELYAQEVSADAVGAPEGCPDGAAGDISRKLNTRSAAWKMLRVCEINTAEIL
jgi:hypothetical protein